MTDRELIEKVFLRVYRFDRDFVFRVLVRYARWIQQAEDWKAEVQRSNEYYRFKEV